MDIGRIKHGEMTSQGYPSSSQSFGSSSPAHRPAQPGRPVFWV
jgi:hypothetical protein